MSTLVLADGREIAIAGALNDQLQAASIESASHAAQVLDVEGSPALLLITGGELAYIRRRGVQRWKPAEVKRVEATEIDLLAAPSISIGAWGAVGERADFLRAATALLQPNGTVPVALGTATENVAPDPPPVAAPTPPPTHVVLARNVDVVLITISALALLLAMSLAPEVTSCRLNQYEEPSVALYIVAVIAPLGFFVAAFAALLCRVREVSRIGAFLVYVAATLVSGVIVIMLVSPCAWSS